MNAYLDEAAGEIVQRRQYHIGLATATAGRTHRAGGA